MVAAGAGNRRARLLCAAAALLLLSLPGQARCAPTFSELVLDGFRQLEGGRNQEALESFAAALDIEPESAPARRGLASAGVALGVARLRAGRLRESRAFLERAVAAQPESAEYRLLLARVLFHVADARAARREIDRALELAPGSTAARELSGDLYEREGLLNLAVGEWETAAAAGGSAALAGKIARGLREMAAEEGMGRESGRHFLILYDREVPQELVAGFFAALDRAFDAVHDLLGDYPRDDITVLLYSRAGFAGITAAPDWSGGLYDGKIRVPVGGLTRPEEIQALQSILAHEMTHAFLHRLAPVGLPLWFNEGVATAFQGWDPGHIRALFAERPPEGLGSLEAVDRALRGRGGNVLHAYMAARLAVDEMRAMRGEGAIRRVVAGVGAGESFAEVFRDEMRADLAEFEERWRGALR